MTDKPVSQSEKAATVDEVSETIGKLHSEEWTKLYAFAENRAQYMRTYGASVDGEDLVQRAVFELLEERRTWNPKKVSFFGVLMGAMKSIASNHKAKSLRSGYSVSNSQLSGGGDEEDQGQTPLERTADPRLTPELQMVATEHENQTSTLVVDLYELFEADAEAQLVMNGWRNGQSGRSIMDDLGIDKRAYETIAKRIRRKSTARWPKGSNYVSQ